MSGAFIFREAPAELDHYVWEAVEQLGYFRGNRIVELAEIYRRLWVKGVSGKMLNYNDLDEMNEDEKREAGLGRGRMPRIIWQLLSDKGRLDPHLAVEATTNRVFFNLRRHEDNAAEAHWGAFASQVQFVARARSDYHCSRSLALNGIIMARRERFDLPLSECDKEWCPCRWDGVLDLDGD